MTTGRNITTQFDEYINDPRVVEAKATLKKVLLEYQSRLSGPTPSHPELREDYQNKLISFGKHRGGNLIFPYIGSGLGKGALVELADGSVKYDFISGIGVHWGHSLPDIVDASLNAALQDVVMQGNLQQNMGSLNLSDCLVTASKLDHCFLSSSGAMANENAVKIIFQKKSPAPRLFAFERCFMGRTLLMSSISDKPGLREGLPRACQVDYVPFYDDERPDESTQEAVAFITQQIARFPKAHAGMCMELIQGEGGYYPGSQAFFKAIIKVLKDADIKVLVDEIQTFGRTPSLFAFQDFGLEGLIDVVTIGKLGQVCATLYTSEMAPNSGLLSQTYTSSTSAIESSLVIIKSLLNDGYLGPNGKIQTYHRHFVSGLKTLHDRYPDEIDGPYGYGVMVAFTPFKGDKERVTQLMHVMFEKGVMCFIAGGKTPRLRFLMPMGGVKKADIDTVLELIEASLLECRP